MQKSLHSFELEIFDSIDELPDDERLLVEEALNAKKKAYAPYSKFHVGAAVATRGIGQIRFAGSNQETAVYNGTHAERSALDNAAQNGKKEKISKIAIVGDAPGPLTPCGPCRQDIKEVEDLSGSPITIIMAGSRGEVWRVLGIDSLLPLAFGPANLK